MFAFNLNELIVNAAVKQKYLKFISTIHSVETTPKDKKCLPCLKIFATLEQPLNK